MRFVYVMQKEAMGAMKDWVVFTSAEKAIEHIMGGQVTELSYHLPMTPNMKMAMDPKNTGFRAVALKLKHEYGVSGKVDDRDFSVVRVNVNPPIPDSYKDVL